MKKISIGKFRGLQQTSTAFNAFAVCALDHRNNLRALLRPDNPEAATVEEMVAFKVDLVHALAPAASAVLMDPQWSAAQTIAAGVLPGNVGVLVSVEASGYGGSPDARESQVLPGWSVAKIKRMGANAVKLLAYYHPDSPSAAQLEQLVAQVGKDCAEADLPLFVEPLSYSLNPAKKKLDPDERRRVVIETAKRLTPLGVDVLKAEFPLDISEVRDEQEWRIACTELSQASTVPWVLLSASVGIDVYIRQVTAACLSGASGVAVGRAVWKEATEVQGQARLDFLHGEARRRMERVTALVDGIARPWTDFFSAEDISPEWYMGYAE